MIPPRRLIDGAHDLVAHSAGAAEEEQGIEAIHEQPRTQLGYGVSGDIAVGIGPGEAWTSPSPSSTSSRRVRRRRHPTLGDRRGRQLPQAVVGPRLTSAKPS
jgi:hypothetical protein